MGILDKLKASVFNKNQKEETFAFQSLPESLAELLALPEASAGF